MQAFSQASIRVAYLATLTKPLRLPEILANRTVHNRFCQGLLAILALAPLFAASPLAAEEPLQIQYNLTDADFRRNIAAFGPDGFQPVSVSGYDVGGEDRYAVIWEKRAAPVPWTEKHNITFDEFQDNFDALLGRGMRPVNLCGYNVAGAARYSAVFELRGGDNWRVRTGASSDDILKSNADFSKDGLRPVSADGYAGGRELRYAVLWEKTQRPANEFRLDLSLSPAQFDQTSKDLVSGGFHPVSLSGYSTEGGTRFAAIWEKSPKAEFEVHPLLAPEQLGELGTRLPANGFRPVSLRAYSTGDKPRFAAIWRKKAS